ncbi:hypothetical protein EMCRGX_G005016 [Ephydatia muelleri]
MMTIVLQYGWSPLNGASINEHLDVVKTLLEAGANINQVANVGIISQDGELVRSGDFIELASCQAKYAIFLVACKLISGRTFCLVQGCDTLCASSGQPILNTYDCPLITVTRTLFT